MLADRLDIATLSVAMPIRLKKYSFSIVSQKN